ncbi:MAG: NFACT RNA binding domain-containing protein [Candidatus Cloacimonas sp.]|jgi:predicted ribosome quality control (RQC) complex YloA/Tae2 family protein|nr:NFACT RNA binding domain-containing protein [Candidatus Cloacimonas sp.]
MKYAYLQAWVKELGDYAATVETCYLTATQMILSLKGGAKLCFVLLSQDAFLYLDEAHLDLAGAKNIWPSIKNAAIEQITLADNDRILSIKLSHRDIYQQVAQYVIVAELMPPQPNLILCNGNMVIIDALRKYTFADNPQRQVLAGLTYLPPKTSFTPDAEPLSAPYPDGAQNCNDYFRARYNTVLQVQSKVDLRAQQSVIVKRELKKLQKKLKLQEQDLHEAEQAEHWRACAEGLKPNLHLVKTGDTSFCTIDYFDPAMAEICIPLQTAKNPKDNLQFYLKKYQKAKKGLVIIRTNIEKTTAEISQTETLLARIVSGEQTDLNLGKTESAKQIIQKASLSDKLLNLKIGEDYQIVIGRKATENDFITTQLARPHDWWFHSRIYHGAHVLLRCFKKQEPSLELIRHCCNLAAWHSQAKFSANVPVDYTQIRFVRKPRKSPPGYVIYSNHHSVYATPMDLRTVKEALKL